MDNEEIICRGCWSLGTACGKCAKCLETKPELPAKGEAMPQTIEAWQRLYGLADDALKRQDKVISRLKQRINKLEQDREQRDG